MARGEMYENVTIVVADRSHCDRKIVTPRTGRRQDRGSQQRDITHCANDNSDPMARFLASVPACPEEFPNILVPVSAGAPVIFHVSFFRAPPGNNKWR